VQVKTYKKQHLCIGDSALVTEKQEQPQYISALKSCMQVPLAEAIVIKMVRASLNSLFDQDDGAICDVAICAFAFLTSVLA
jgi:hypothetical protein